MDAGVSSPEPEFLAGIAFDFPMIDTVSLSPSSSPTKIPTRLQRRLLQDPKTTPPSVEQIEAKLKLADLRRQQFYEMLSRKARSKPRSPSHSSSTEEDLGQRLEAKLQAAEQKRLSILANAQLRLSRLDELRQAAKTEVEIRMEKERERLGTKVESRVQQAEANRMLILKAYRQRRAKLMERASQSLLRRMARESKYKERVRAAINQKRAAAEKKRLGLLEDEKKRARARVSQVRRVANSVSHQRELERRRMQDRLEDRLQKAKRQRAEILRQRGRLHNSPAGVNWKMNKQADILSCKLARCWRRFLKLRKTTLALTRACDALNINEKCVKSMPFEHLARLIESNTTLQTVKALLDRLESRFKVSRAVSSTRTRSSLDNIDHLLKRVASPKKRPTPRNINRSRDAKKRGSIAKNPATLSRYQVRVVLCAYMILGHPDAVFSGQGNPELALATSAENFIREFELLIKLILDGPVQSSDEELDPTFPRHRTFRSQLEVFDAAWCTYLNSFVMWKVKDARSLEEDLVRAACQLELSMIQTCKLTPDGYTSALTHDMKAIQKQVTEDQKLLREKVHHLGGDAGIDRMEYALSDVRSKYFQAKEHGSPIGSPISHFLSTSPPTASSAKTSNRTKDSANPSRVVRALFKEETASPPKVVGFSIPSSSLDAQPRSSNGNLLEDNEFIVNEVVHEQQRAFADSFNVTDENQNIIKAKIRETMEAAFWDGIAESMNEDEPNYDRVVELVREVRDEICEMAPQSWKPDITGAIDLDILSQVLRSGTLDMEFLGQILEFALVTIQKLSAPANDEELKITHQKLMRELAEMCQTQDNSKRSHVIALIKGLRFVLEKIQELKQEISKARIRMMEPVLKGPAGFEYLKKAFENRYGSPSNAALPLTVQWLSSVRGSADEEWDEHASSIAALRNSPESSSKGLLLPSTPLRTGGSISIRTNGSKMSSATTIDNGESECNGEKVDLLVRLGSLKLVSSVSGLTLETLPETLKLNLSRLRSVQSQLQKIIVVSTSILVLRQTLLGEKMMRASLEDMEVTVSVCVERLFELLDRTNEAGIKEIVETISEFTKTGDQTGDAARKEVMARILVKSLQAGDAVFAKVSTAVYLAARGVVFGGSRGGRNLAGAELRRVGAVALTDKVVEAAAVVVTVANVSVRVHGPWYECVVRNM